MAEDDADKSHAKDIADRIERCDYVFLGHKVGGAGMGQVQEWERAIILKALRAYAGNR